MIPESNFYRSYRKGKKARYRIKWKSATADTCSIEKTESGAVIRFPGNITMVATSFEKATGELRYYRQTAGYRASRTILTICEEGM